jgi:hypothetical protein
VLVTVTRAPEIAAIVEDHPVDRAGLDLRTRLAGGAQIQSEDHRREENYSCD